MAVVLLGAGFAAVLAGALLFTNAVEWAGHRLGLGVGAVGTILAGVSTALAESAIPVVAILRGNAEADEVAVGAILGAPFMLATIAMAIVGRSLRPRLRRLRRRHRPVERRHAEPRGAAPAGRRPHEARSSGDHDDLAAVLVGLGLIVGGAHIIVEQLIAMAELIDVSPLILSLLVAPLATELPEKANSFLWIREGKDALALGNITGAMVFQSTLPVAVGLAFTSWQLDRFALLAAVLTLAGGAVALWSLHGQRRFSAWAIIAWVALYSVFAASVWLAD